MASPQAVSGRALDFLLAWEGERLSVYNDSRGLPTIGCGHLLTSEERRTGTILIGGVAVRYNAGLSDAQSSALLQQDLARFERPVRSVFARLTLAQHEYDALVVVAFNLGVGQFSGATFVTRLLNGDRAGAKVAWGWFNKETRIVAGNRVKVVSKGLTKRRAGEIAMFFEGDYSARP